MNKLYNASYKTTQNINIVEITTVYDERINKQS